MFVKEGSGKGGNFKKYKETYQNFRGRNYGVFVNICKKIWRLCKKLRKMQQQQIFFYIFL